MGEPQTSADAMPTTSPSYLDSRVFMFKQFFGAHSMLQIPLLRSRSLVRCLCTTAITCVCGGRFCSNFELRLSRGLLYGNVAERCCLERADAQTGPDDWMQSRRDYQLTDSPNPTQLKRIGAQAKHTHISFARAHSPAHVFFPSLHLVRKRFNSELKCFRPNKERREN